MEKYWHLRHHLYGVKLGFDIPCNVFGKGLNIHHYGAIVVNSGARVGDYCNIQQGVLIGGNNSNDSVPTIGNNVYIGSGAKIFGKIYIADGIVIGANSVVNRTFTEPNIIIAGIPAEKIGHVRHDFFREWEKEFS